MPVLDRREPGIYVTIEDASYVAPALEVGRVGYIVILGPKGPHDRIVKCTSLNQYYELFGKPSQRRYSQSAYNAVKFLQYSSNLLVCRVVPDDSYWSNAYIEHVNDNKIKTKSDQFTFTAASDTVTTDAVGIKEVNVGDKIYRDGDSTSDAVKIIAIDETTNTITLAANYGGTSGTAAAYIYYITDSAQFDFTAGSNQVTTDAAGFDEIALGDWIYPADGTDSSYACQVIAKDDSGGTPTITLDREYQGSTIADQKVYKYINYRTTSKSGIDNENDFDPLAADVPYYFYAVGAGEYYNNIIIKGVRNTDYEKMYMDDNGNVLYKYMFMDIAIYYKDTITGNLSLLEGPWTVSLIPRTPDESPVRDLSSGALMYIEYVINQNSNYVNVISANGVDDLIYTTSTNNAESNRLAVMLELSSASPKKTQYDTISGSVPKGGVNFENGTDGTGLYNTAGLISPDAALYAKVTRAYNCTLQSVDGTVEQMLEVTYPWYEPDYIITGGFPANVQNGGRELSSYREDCITLADTGGYKTSYSQDLDARLNDVPWNTWTAALYVQYRKISDPFSGEPLWINPVYHAVERHLYCDGAYFLAEPVAGIEKGAIQEPITLAYKANHTERGDLIDVELNPVIVEPQGKYILTQFTTWKRLSVLKRLHVAKFVAYLRKMIPPLLKDLLQRRATQYWINQANVRVTNFLNNFLENPAVERYSVLKSFSVNVVFDEVASELNVYIDITPIRAIERINVFIIVH